MNIWLGRACALMGGLLLSGCGDAFLAPMKDTWSLVLGSGGEVAYDPADARALPYATMEAYIGDAPAGMTVLGRVVGQDLHWISADRNAVVTRDGRIVATAGLPSNLLKTLFIGTDPLTAPTPDHGQRQIDLSFGSSYGVLVSCDWRRLGRRTIDIRSVAVDTTLWEEDCAAPTLDWTFANRFWRDGSGFVWKSVQHYSPDAPPMTTAILKPYRP